MTVISGTIQLKGYTASEWTTSNPVLLVREKGVETDTLKEKIGDGVTAWNSLPYMSGGSGGQVDSIQSGTPNVIIDNTDPTSPIISVSSETTSETELIHSIDTDKVNALHELLPITTPTYDGSGQATHPSVLYFEDGFDFNGVLWKYVMAMTPYPFANDDLENPSILVSNDAKLGWQVPTGLTNPIVPFSGGTTHLADTELIHGYDGKLYCYYRWTDSATQSEGKIYVTSSIDGITWGTPVLVLSGDYLDFLSPAVIKIGGKYRMYFIDGIDPTERLAYRESTSPDSLTLWESSPEITCTVNNIPSGSALWHIDVNVYYNEIHIFQNFSKDNTNGVLPRLYFSKSVDGGDTFEVSNNVLLNIEANGWINNTVYRGSGILKNNNQYELWYGGADSDNEWRIGNTVVNLFNNNIVTTEEKYIFNYYSLNPETVYTTKKRIATGIVTLLDNNTVPALSPLNTNADWSELILTGFSSPIASIDGSGFGVWSDNEGKLVLIIGADNDKVYQFKFVKQLDGSTIRYTGTSFYIGNKDNGPLAVKMNDAKTAIYITGNQFDDLYKYNITLDSDGFIDTFVFDSTLLLSTINVSINTPVDLEISPDETKITVFNSFNSTLYDIALAVAGDLTTASAVNTPFNVGITNNTGRAFTFIKDGNNFIISTYNNVRQYSVTTPYTTIGAVYSALSHGVGGVSSIRGISYYNNGNKALIIDNILDKIFDADVI